MNEMEQAKAKADDPRNSPIDPLTPEQNARIRRSYYRTDADVLEGDSLVGTKLDLDPNRALHIHEGNQPGTGVNARQIGGAHYGLKQFQHWDIVAMFDLDYFQGQITKYVMRWRDKNGVEDLEKAGHYLEKYIEIERARQSFPTVGNEIAADADQIPLSMNDAPETTQ